MERIQLSSKQWNLNLFLHVNRDINISYHEIDILTTVHMRQKNRPFWCLDITMLCHYNKKKTWRKIGKDLCHGIMVATTHFFHNIKPSCDDNSSRCPCDNHTKREKTKMSITNHKGILIMFFFKLCRIQTLHLDHLIVSHNYYDRCFH